MFKINTPIWNSRSVGLDQSKVEPGMNRVEILYENKAGEREFPFIYEIHSDKIMESPKQYLKKGVVVRLVKISDMDIIETLGE